MDVINPDEESDYESDTLTPKERRLAPRIIRRYFRNAPGWDFVKHLGGGQFGDVFKVKRGDQELAVKICYGAMALKNRFTLEQRREREDAEQIIHEERLLRAMRGCGHIIQTFTLPDDPLGRPPPPGVQEHGMDAWVFMEVLPNGNLTDFWKKYRSHYAHDFMPNRVLWRFLMCMVRICLDLGFYSTTGVDVRTTSLDELQRWDPGVTIHNDVHAGNVMIGLIMPDIQTPEHSITPLFKAIDFGMADDSGNRPSWGEPAGAQKNLKDFVDALAYEMFKRFLFGDEIPTSRGSVTMGGVTFKSGQGALWEKRNMFTALGLDVDLLEILVLCSSEKAETQPKLTDVAIKVRQELVRRDAAFYNSAHEETDEYIQEMMGILLG